eukprot:SAG31_NODE_15190_length_766_cov_1.121439_1_plen_34_part_10
MMGMPVGAGGTRVILQYFRTRTMTRLRADINMVM